MRCPRCSSRTVSLVPAADRMFCAKCGRWNEVPAAERIWLAKDPADPQAARQVTRSA